MRSRNWPNGRPVWARGGAQYGDIFTGSAVDGPKYDPHAPAVKARAEEEWRAEERYRQELGDLAKDRRWPCFGPWVA